MYQIIVLVLFLGTSLFSFYVSYLNYKNRNAVIPATVENVYELPKYEKWLKYFMDTFKFDTVKNLINTVLILILLFSGFFGLLSKVSIRLTDYTPLQTLYFMLGYFILSFILDFIFDYYHTFKIEEKYGFNKTTKKRFISDKIKGLFLTIILGGALLYLVAVLYQNISWTFYIYTYIALMTILVIVNMLYVKLFVPLFNKLTPLEDGPLKEEIMKFAEKEGIQISKISVMNASLRSTKLNAYFSGFGKMKQIVLYDTLIDKMSVEEVVSVLAHEIGHSKHNHIVKGMFQTASILVFYMVALYIVLNLSGFYTAFGVGEVQLGFGLILFLVLLSPLEILLGFITNYVSRVHEYEADKFSVTHYQKESMISALKVLARNNFSNLTPHPLYVKLMYSHPPIKERIDAILRIE